MAEMPRPVTITDFYLAALVRGQEQSDLRLTAIVEELTEITSALAQVVAAIPPRPAPEADQIILREVETPPPPSAVLTVERKPKRLRRS